MITISDLLKHAGRIHSDTPQLDAQILLAHCLGRSRTWLYTWPEREVPKEAGEAFLALLARRARGEPVAHLLGRREFWSLSLEVNPSTLIPRPETELLVETALSLDLPPRARVLDLGTGTGAIALALASERPGWRVTAVDSSPEAVSLATRNAASLGLERVRIEVSDWFSAVAGRFDLVVSNPPYIAPGDSHLSQGDVRFEPESALVAGEGGLADIMRIVAESPAHLNGGGWLAVEHGAGQGPDVRDLFREHGFERVTTARDLGDRERITRGRWPA